MRLSNQLAVGSPTARAAAIAVATLLLAAMTTGAVVAGAAFLNAPGIIVVAGDGTGDTTSIGEAVRRAEDGSTIVVRAGAYVESVRVTKDVTIMGDDRDSVVISAASDTPWVPVGDAGLGDGTSPYAFHLVDVDATLSDLTLRGPDSVVLVVGGASQLLDLSFQAVRPLASDGVAGGAIVLTGGATAIVRGNHLDEGGSIAVYDRSEPDIDTNTLEGGGSIWGAFGDAARIRGNRIVGARSHGIEIMAPTRMRIESNTIVDAPVAGISVGVGHAIGIDPMIVGNSISGSRSAIRVAFGAEPTIMTNDIAVGREGINIVSSSPAIRANTFRGGLPGPEIWGDVRAAVFVGGGSPTIDGNVIEGIDFAVWTGASGSPTIVDNEICLLDGDAAAEELASLRETNAICS